MNMQDYYKMLQEAVKRNAELEAKRRGAQHAATDSQEEAEPDASAARS